MNKKQIALYNSYCRADARTLADVYGRYSVAKQHAYNEILAECASVGGYDVRIPSATGFFFTMAYRYDASDGVRLVYHTHANRWEFLID